MKPCVVDASTIAAALFEEKYASEARSVLVATSELHAPDLVYPEVGNVIWKRFTRGDLEEGYALELLDDLMDIPLAITSCQELTPTALPLALLTKRTVYDCLYVSLAMRHDCSLVTADKRLVHALGQKKTDVDIVWLGTLGGAEPA